MGSNPGEVDFFSIYIDTFWGSNPGEVNFFPSSFFFLLSRECNSIEGCCLCCSINFYLWDVFSVQICLHGSQ